MLSLFSHFIYLVTTLLTYGNIFSIYRIEKLTMQEGLYKISGTNWMFSDSWWQWKKIKLHTFKHGNRFWKDYALYETKIICK